MSFTEFSACFNPLLVKSHAVTEVITAENATSRLMLSSAFATSPNTMIAMRAIDAISYATEIPIFKRPSAADLFFASSICISPFLFVVVVEFAV
jgi:hypothetical protein